MITKEMTKEDRELAITYLKEMQETYIEGDGYERHPLPEYYAIETALEALEQEPCEDAISRQAVLDEMNIRRDNGDMITAGFIKGLSPIQPKAKVGKWKYYQNKKGNWINECSVCKRDAGVGYPYSYCPNCGAKMEVEE